jgi:hypothetical protein
MRMPHFGSPVDKRAGTPRVRAAVVRNAEWLEGFGALVAVTAAR